MAGICEVLSGKRILIWGYGREGKATEEFIKSHCADTIYEIYEGDLAGIDENKWDLIIKSPGIVMLEDREKFTSETELFLDEFADRTIGITGTKGKSTTSTLMQLALQGAGRKCVLLGNIGEPCFKYVDEIDDETMIVFELSAHQLLHINKAPKYAIFLNLYPEHLDYYGTVENYFNAKANITKKQTAEDFVLLGGNVPFIESPAQRKVIVPSGKGYGLMIPGEHNALNFEFVRTMAVDILGLPEKNVVESGAEFGGLPHRLQYVGEKDGVRFYDDSISTIPEAAISAANCIERVSVLLIGGMDRGIDYEKLEGFIDERRDLCFVLMYASGKRIYEEMTGKGLSGNMVVTDNLEEAVAVAKERAAKGTAIVLSPAAASYGYFKNFEERGDKFKEIADCR